MLVAARSLVLGVSCLIFYPLLWPTQAQEINFHGLVALLSFGGAHEPELARLTGSSVEDAAKFGLIGSHLSR